MFPDACSGPPKDSAELARAATDPSQPEETRCRAMERLLPKIRLIAQQAASRFAERLRQDLVDEAGSMIWARLSSFDPSKGRFEEWCRVVLRRAFLDEWRKGEGGIVRPAAGGVVGRDVCDMVADPAPSPDADAECLLLVELRQALDRIAWKPASPHNVDYYAVLLLHLRLAIARCLSPGLAADADAPTTTSDLVAWCLRWNPEEQECCIRSGWPTLARIWCLLSPGLCQPPYRMDSPQLCQIINELLPAASGLSADLWNQWVKRAKTEARRRLHDEQLWRRIFRRLLPDRW